MIERLTPASEHVLDRIHITMRLTVLSQYARGVAHNDEAQDAGLLKSIECMKWLLWQETSCELLMQAEAVPSAMKAKLREVKG